MSDLWKRLKREAKANGAKAGLLAGLFLFGCCFWVPMLARAVTPKRTTTPTTPAVAQGLSNAIEMPLAKSEGNTDSFWSSLTKSLAADPMFQSSEVHLLERDPFQATEVPEPLPVLFAAEPLPKIEPKPKQESPLELKSTIIGRTRRAALINGQMYQLGKQINTNGQSYRLTKIESNRVVLSAGEQTIELSLSRKQLKDVLNRSEETWSTTVNSAKPIGTPGHG